MNQWEGIGNLTRDPELRYSQNEVAICKFSVAINEGYGDDEKTNFIPVTVFGKQAENCDKYLQKGRKVAIVGRLESGRYEKENGDMVYTLQVIANRVEFLGGQKKNDEPEGYEPVDDSYYEDFEDME